VVLMVFLRSCFHPLALSLFLHCGAQDGSTALICAAEYGHVECARLLLDAGADQNAKSKVFQVGPARLRLC
jgi:hypothetical protein